MHVLFLLFLLFPAFTENADDLYGSYRMAEEGMILELTPPNNYTLFVVERDKRSGMVTSKELSRGTFAEKDDQLELSGQMSKKMMTLSTAEENKLKVKKLMGLEQGDEFLRWSGYDESGKVKFEGSWRKGKKHGDWVYFDEDGNVQKRETYKRGKLKS